MARNEEKAQSMLYRFREAQAAELGLSVRGDRRPRMASTCKSLRDCERWRGEILREISRKVSKIQDAGLSDYETRDLNDEINKLMREKRHWENQIVALGGANYRRNVAMLDDDGKEVPGTKGYKYFGRAKDLPGVRELFMSKAKDEDEETQAMSHYKKFLGQGPAYFGDLDEADKELLEFERDAEETDWDAAYTRLRETLSLPLDDDIPKMVRKPPAAILPTFTADNTPPSDAQPTAGKRKAEDASEGTTKESKPGDGPKRAKTKTKSGTAPTQPPPSTVEDNAERTMTPNINLAFIPFLTPADLAPPKLPTRAEMEEVLLAVRKKALLEEFIG